jgi:hypothetical protein
LTGAGAPVTFIATRASSALGPRLRGDERMERALVRALSLHVVDFAALDPSYALRLRSI